jgi:hypothetical protein
LLAFYVLVNGVRKAAIAIRHWKLGSCKARGSGTSFFCIFTLYLTLAAFRKTSMLLLCKQF